MKRYILASILSVALVSSLLPYGVGAATTQQDRIQELLRQITTLQAELNRLRDGSTPVTSSPFHFSKDLREGMTDNDIWSLQQLLRTDKTIYADGRITGYFGPLTKAAVRNFQARFGITGEDGYVGPRTRMYINAVISVGDFTGPIPAGLLARPNLVRDVNDWLSRDDDDDDQDDDDDRDEDEDDDDDDDRDSDEIDSFLIELRERSSRVTVEFDDGSEDTFSLSLFDRRDVIEELADRYDMDEEDVEDIADFEDFTEIDEIEVEIDEDDDEALVTVRYTDDDTGDYEFTVDETDEDEIIEEIADELDIDEDEVEDLIEFEDGDDDIDEINVVIDESDERAYVTVEYEDGDEDEFDFSVDMDDDEDEIEEDAIEEIAEELDMDEDDVEDLVDFDYED